MHTLVFALCLNEKIFEDGIIIIHERSRFRLSNSIVSLDTWLSCFRTLNQWVFQSEFLYWVHCKREKRFLINDNKRFNRNLGLRNKWKPFGGCFLDREPLFPTEVSGQLDLPRGSFHEVSCFTTYHVVYCLCTTYHVCVLLVYCVTFILVLLV